MATTSKKGGKKTKPKPQGLSPTASYSALKKGFAAQAQEIREGAEQQAATSEILRNVRQVRRLAAGVSDALAECAARLCDAKDAQIFRVEDNGIRRVAAYGDLPIALEHTPLIASLRWGVRWSTGKSFTFPTFRPTLMLSFRSSERTRSLSVIVRL